MKKMWREYSGADLARVMLLWYTFVVLGVVVSTHLPISIGNRILVGLFLSVIPYTAWRFRVRVGNLAVVDKESGQIMACGYESVRLMPFPFWTRYYVVRYPESMRFYSPLGIT